MINQFYVDKNFYESNDIEKRIDIIHKTDGMQDIAGKKIAVCVQNPFDVICIYQFIRKDFGSMVLLPSQTPLQTAINIAEQYGCYALFYDTLETLIDFKEWQEQDVPSLFQFSSGTTGKPKMICRPWTEVDQEIASYNEILAVDAAVTPIILANVSHSFGLIAGILTAFQRGAQPLILSNKNPKYHASIIKKNNHSIVYAVPFMLHLIHAIDNSVRYHKVISSGAPLTGQLFLKLQNHADEMLQQYGSTETGCIALGHNIKAYTDVGKPLKHFKIQLNGSQENPEEIIVGFQDRIIHTNDLGYTDVEERIHLLGRCDDLINVAGLKVLPYEVEEVIRKIDGVSEVVVYKTKHPVWGEAVKAMLVGSKQISGEQVRDFCIQQLPPYKVPGAIQIVSEIPKTATGKISRKLLQESEGSKNEQIN